MDYPVSKITGQPSRLTAQIRRSVGIGGPKTQPQPPRPSTPQQKSQTIENAVRKAVTPLATELAAMIHAAGIPAYQPPSAPPRPGMVTAGQAARSGNDIRAMTHILAQRPRPHLDAVTGQRMIKQSQIDATQHQAAVYRAAYGAGYEGDRPGLNASPNDIRAAIPPAIFSPHDGLTEI